jgi:hypothetical protein
LTKNDACVKNGKSEAISGYERPENLKGVKLRTALTILTLCALCTLVGCTGSQKGRHKEENDILTVDFVEGQTLQYRFVAGRDVTIEWDQENKMSKDAKNSVDTNTETLDIVMAYTPVELNPFALTTVKATCKSAKVTRTRRAGAGSKDAAEHFAGKSYTLKVGPTGKIEDNSELNEAIKQVGEKAFRKDSKQGRIKDPDMVNDIVATQWFLWDSISSIPQDSDGLIPGRTWKSQLSLPSPIVMRKARDVVYKLDEIRSTPRGKVAIISSSYSMAESNPPGSWPIPYSGSFRVSGTFGFLGGFKLLGVNGTGQETFNIDTGQLEEYTQNYEMKLSSIIPLGLSAKPAITIRQTITAKKL